MWLRHARGYNVRTAARARTPANRVRALRHTPYTNPKGRLKTEKAA
ncbi:hypothetical protein HMPREF9123_1926 [Neisseria bacilliformis ATCC BAA-1200]|uniref:Uncharacterized protein n=1 Tax=Neisseria bacilliformis ATCC BAA-1200 TaxID=888742 RepID=F2BDX0_9NEIS|nr:hypothetical protein HMPREF9123_1926 [Neisseria bacilliformis ATCC BAA-1200]